MKQYGAFYINTASTTFKFLGLYSSIFSFTDSFSHFIHNLDLLINVW